MSEVLTAYDSGNGDLKDIFTYAGITRAELAKAKAGDISSKDKSLLSWGRTSHFSAEKGEVSHTVPRKDGGSTQVYSRPLYRWDSTAYTKANGSSYKAFIGHSAKAGWFAIMKNCGNLVTKKIPKPAPGGAITATCSIIKGYAYDGRRTDLKVKVTIYAGGPPGKGDKIGQLTADDSGPKAPAPGGAGHGFTLNVPQKYRTTKNSTTVYGIMTPLSGWSQSTVQIGKVTIPGNCTPPTSVPEPVAECTSLTFTRIGRTKISLAANGQVVNGASIDSYSFFIKNNAGEVLKQKVITTSQNHASAGEFELLPGDYTANVVIKTSLGEKTSSGCLQTITIAPPERCALNPDLEATSPECQPCPGDTSIWIKGANCEAELVQGKLGANLTQNISDADNTTAHGGDRIEYTIFVQNIGLAPLTTSLEEELTDVLEYGKIQDNGGGTFDQQTKKLRWDNVTLKPNERQTRKFVIELNETTPATPQGTSNPASYDCKLTNTFGNTVEIKMDCPTIKVVEQTVTELPKTGAGENIIFAGIVLSVVTYFYLRSRQLGKEVRLIRHDFTSGTI